MTSYTFRRWLRPELCRGFEQTRAVLRFRPRLCKSALSLIKPSQTSTDPTLLFKLARWKETYLLSATHAALCPCRKLDCKTNIWKWFYLICVYILSVILGLLCGIFSIKRVGVWPGGQTKGSQGFGSLLIAGPTTQEGIQVQAGSHGVEKLLGGLLISIVGDLNPYTVSLLPFRLQRPRLPVGFRTFPNGTTRAREGKDGCNSHWINHDGVRDSHSVTQTRDPRVAGEEGDLMKGGNETPPSRVLRVE